MERGIAECPVLIKLIWKEMGKTFTWPNQRMTTICFYSFCTCCYTASCHLFLFSSQHNLNDRSQASPERIFAPCHSWAIHYSTIPWPKNNCKYFILHFYCTEHNSTKCSNCHYITPDRSLCTHFHINCNNDGRVIIDSKSWKSDDLRFIHKHAFTLLHICKTNWIIQIIKNICILELFCNITEPFP